MLNWEHLSHSSESDVPSPDVEPWGTLSDEESVYGEAFPCVAPWGALSDEESVDGEAETQEGREAELDQLQGHATQPHALHAQLEGRDEHGHGLQALSFANVTTAKQAAALLNVVSESISEHLRNEAQQHGGQGIVALADGPAQLALVDASSDDGASVDDSHVADGHHVIAQPVQSLVLSSMLMYVRLVHREGGFHL